MRLVVVIVADAMRGGRVKSYMGKFVALKINSSLTAVGVMLVY
jgi:hypothetical protein